MTRRIAQRNDRNKNLEENDTEVKREESIVTTAEVFRAEETQMQRDEILNDSAFTVSRYGRSLCSQQSINMADSPKAAFVQVLLADPLSRYLRGTCVGRTVLSRRFFRQTTRRLPKIGENKTEDRKHGVFYAPKKVAFKKFSRADEIPPIWRSQNRDSRLFAGIETTPLPSD